MTILQKFRQKQNKKVLKKDGTPDGRYGKQSKEKCRMRTKKGKEELDKKVAEILAKNGYTIIK